MKVKAPRNQWRYNPDCACEVCVKKGIVEVDDPSLGHSFSFGEPHVPPR